MAIEEDPPAGEDPLIWILLTSLPVSTFEDVVKVIQYYLCRWEIETFFKVLKSGCKIEERQLQTKERMKALITVFMILAWRVMFTMMMGRVYHSSRKTHSFMGGFYGLSDKEGPPGVKVVWNGMARMVDFALAWEAFGT